MGSFRQTRVGGSDGAFGPAPQFPPVEKDRGSDWATLLHVAVCGLPLRSVLRGMIVARQAGGDAMVGELAKNKPPIMATAQGNVAAILSAEAVLCHMDSGCCERNS
jgi:hypothetical protein